MPAPVPKRSQRRPSASRSAQNVRMPTASSASPRSASTQPTAPQYGPRGAGLEVGDGPQRAWTWARRTPSPGGNVAASSSRQPHARAQPPATPSTPGGPARGAPRRRTARSTLDGAGPADVRQVVADQVDDHDVLGVVLGQHGRRRSSAVPLIGPRLHQVAAAAQEQLGRGADDLQARPRARRTRPAYGAGLPSREQRRPGRRRSAASGSAVAQHAAEVDLVDLAGRDPVDGCPPRLRGKPVRPASCARPSPARARRRPGARQAGGRTSGGNRTTSANRTQVTAPSNVTTTAQNPPRSRPSRSERTSRTPDATAPGKQARATRGS